MLPTGRSEFNYLEVSGCPRTKQPEKRKGPTVRVDPCHDACSGSEVYDKRPTTHDQGNSRCALSRNISDNVVESPPTVRQVNLKQRCIHTCSRCIDVDRLRLYIELSMAVKATSLPQASTVRQTSSKICRRGSSSTAARLRQRFMTFSLAISSTVE